MKKFIFTIMLAIIIGVIYGKLIFNQYDKELKDVFKEKKRYISYNKEYILN